MFSSSSAQHKQKLKVAVEIELNDGTLMMGHMFVAQAQRLSDLLNDERMFLPFETSEGMVMTLRKAVITRVIELGQKVSQHTGNNPYLILGVGEDAEDVEVKQAYRERVREVHPDKWAGLGLPDEINEVVNKKMAKINDAYHRILKARGAVRAAQKD